MGAKRCLTQSKPEMVGSISLVQKHQRFFGTVPGFLWSSRQIRRKKFLCFSLPSKFLVTAKHGVSKRGKSVQTQEFLLFILAQNNPNCCWVQLIAHYAVIEVAACGEK